MWFGFCLVEGVVEWREEDWMVGVWWGVISQLSCVRYSSLSSDGMLDRWDEYVDGRNYGKIIGASLSKEY